MSTETRHCPRCGQKRMTKYPALSRLDNKSQVCSECGTDEALTAFIGKPAMLLADWWINIDPNAQAILEGAQS
jgi:hypothetical protein